MNKGTPTLDCVKELPTDSILEEGDQWFAVATSWWEQFQACQRAEKAPSVHNEPLIDKQLSSKTRKVAVLKPNLEEGTDFVFVPGTAWEVISRELDFDWEIRREVIYQRSQQQLQIEPYPFAFKIFYWISDQSAAEELVDDLNRLVVVLGSRVHTMGQLLGEVWLAGPEDFRSQFPQFLGGIASDSLLSAHSTTSDDPIQVRVCYRTVCAADGEPTWTPIEKMIKRRRTAPTSLQKKPRASKRQARDTDSLGGGVRADDDADSEAELDEHPDQLEGDSSGLIDIGNMKLGDLRLDDRSETASGAARLHELLVEQRSTPQASTTSQHLGWPSQGRELQWRLMLARDHELDALDTTNRWFEARVLNARRNKVFVHYRGWDSKWDEWIPRTSPRIAPPHTHVVRWRGNLQAGSLVQVGLQVPGLRHAKWRNASVLEVATSSASQQKQNAHTEGKQEEDEVKCSWDDDGSSRLRVHVQVDSDDFWLPAQDDLLCQPSTHHISKPLSERERRLLAHDETLAEESSEAEDGSDSEGDPDEIVEIEDDDAELLDNEGGSSPPSHPPRVPSHPPRATGAAVETTTMRPTRTKTRAHLGTVQTARNLNSMFDQIRGQGANRAPEQDRSSVHRFRTDTTRAQNAFRLLWNQTGDELHASWTRLGEGLEALVTSTQTPANPQGEGEGGRGRQTPNRQG